MRLLLVEDSARLAEALRIGLAGEGFAVDCSRTLEEARDALRDPVYDLVLLDLGFPDGDGIALLRGMRAAKNAVPILVISARGGLGERVLGLDSGADDYLVKPFAMVELAARCRALLRRPGSSLGAVLQAGNVSLDSTSRQVRIDDATVEVPPRELALLEQLMRRQGMVVPKAMLESSLYAGDAEVTPNAVEAAVSRLRKRLASPAPRWRSTRRTGSGTC